MSQSVNRQELLEKIVHHAVELAKLLYQADPDTVKEALFRVEQELMKLFSSGANVPVFESVILLVEAELGGRFDDSELAPCLRHVAYIYYLLSLILKILYYRLYDDYCSDPVCRRLMPTNMVSLHLTSARGIVHSLITALSNEIALLDRPTRQLKYIDRDRFNITAFSIEKLIEVIGQVTHIEKLIRRTENEVYRLNTKFGELEAKIRKLIELIEQKKQET